MSDMIFVFLSLAALLGAYPVMILVDVPQDPAQPRFQVLHPVQD